jgi:hypothetical protein
MSMWPLLAAKEEELVIIPSITPLAMSSEKSDQ